MSESYMGVGRIRMLATVFATDGVCGMTATGRVVSSMLLRCFLPFEDTPAKLPIFWEPREHFTLYPTDGNGNGGMARRGSAV